MSQYEGACLLLNSDFILTLNTYILEVNKRKAKSQVINGLSEGKQRALPLPIQISTVMANEEDPIDADIP